MKEFLAEDFRNLINTIDQISEKDSTQDEQNQTDTKDLLVTNRPQNIEKSDVNNVYELIDYLDQFPELSKYRNPSAQYDDAFYESIPLDDLLQIADLTKEDLIRIDDDTKAYEGAIYIYNDVASVFGGD